MPIFIAASGCSRLQDVKKGDPLWPLIGTKYTLVTDCYVVQYVESNDGLKGPILTCNIKKPGTGSPELPVAVKSDFIGRVYGSVKVIGIVLRGTLIKIAGVKRLVSFEDKIPILEVEKIGPDGREMPDEKYDVLWLLNRKNINLGFDESVAHRIHEPTGQP